jgi:FkbM family methyltransferase
MGKKHIYTWIKEFFKYKPFENILFFFTKNATSNNFRYKLAPTPETYNSQDQRVVVRRGIKLKLRLNDLVDWYAFWKFDDGIFTILNQINECYIVIDIGTNIGIVALNMAKKVGKKGFVLGFEPNKLTYARCMENVQLNAFENIKILNNALGNKSETMFLSEPDINNSGRNFLTTNHNSNIVNVMTLDEVLQDRLFEKIDFIKIDVEGFEYNVLLGAINSIKRFKPILFIELITSNLERNGSSALEIISLLFDLGYNIKNVVNNDIIDKITDFSSANYDIICIPN